MKETTYTCNNCDSPQSIDLEKTKEVRRETQDKWTVYVCDECSLVTYKNQNQGDKELIESMPFSICERAAYETMIREQY